MTRLDILGYVQIVVGVLGTVATMLTAPALLDAVGTVVDGGGLPSEFATASGAIRLFVVTFLMLVMLLMVVFGMSLTMGRLFAALGAGQPILAALFSTIGTASLALVVTLAILGQAYWIPGLVATIGFFAMALTACDKPNQGNVTGVGIITVIAFLGVGLFTVLAVNTPRPHTITSSPID